MLSWCSSSSKHWNRWLWVPAFAGTTMEFSLHLREPIVQGIAGAAHGADRILLTAGVEQFAEPPDMHVHRAFIDVNIAAPYAVEQLLAAEHPSWMLQEKFQQPVLGRAEIDRTSRPRDTALLAIEFDVAIGEDGGETFRTGATQQAPDPRQQFRHRERLDDVIVGAGGKAPDPFAFLAARGQHDDRKLPGFRPRPQPAAQFDPRQPRQHPIQHDKVGNALLQPGVGVIAAPDCLDVIAFSVEVVAQQCRQGLLVFHYKNARAHMHQPLSFGLPSLQMSSCRPSGACRGSADPRSCRTRFPRCWWRGRQSVRCSWRRTSDECRN